MNREEITASLTKYKKSRKVGDSTVFGSSMEPDRAHLTDWLRKQEIVHRVENWMYRDWHVWPVLRMSLAMRLIYRKQQSQGMVWMKRALRPAWRLLRIAATWRHSPNRFNKTGEMEYAVVAIATARRPDIVEGKAISPFVGVLMEWLETWQIPAISIEAFCDNDLRNIPRPYKYCIWEYMVEPEVRLPFFSIRVPWSKAFREMEHELGLDPVSITMFELIERKAEFWKSYFKSHKTKLCLVNCWYGVLSTMPVVLAAKRLGIPTVDIQHGSHDEYHPAYGAWTKAPLHGYEMVPDFFWCWSQNMCQLFKEANPGLETTTECFAGGNLWLNQNTATLLHQNLELYDKAVKWRSEGKRTILICLCGNSLERGLYPSLKWVIEKTPDTWHWMFRLHPIDRKHRKTIELILNAPKFGHRVDLDFSNQLSLFECVSLCDVMISDWSTCAQEGLAFGKPCVIIHPNGRNAYERQIADGSMIYAEEEEIPGALRRALHISGNTCRKSAEYSFVSKEKSYLTVRSFFQTILNVENYEQNVRTLE